MQRPYLVGERLYLRPLEEADLREEYLSWVNDREVTRYMRTGKWPVTMAELRKYWERFQHSSTDLILAIIDRKTEQHIGTLALNNIDWIYRTADTGIMVGRKDFWGKGYGFEAWSLLIEYAFTGLDLRKIVAGASPLNVGSVRALEKLGFKLEGTLRQHALVESQYIDSFLFGLLRDEFYKFREQR